MMDGRPIGRDYPAQLRVKNLEPWFDDMLMPEDLDPKKEKPLPNLLTIILK